MSEGSSSSPGFIDSLRRLGDGLLGTVHDRLELFTIELQEEKLRIIRTLILVNAAIFSAFLGLTFLTLTIVYLFWDSARIWVLAGFTLLYIAVCAGILVALKRHLGGLAKPFEGTRGELKADRASLKPE